MRINPRFLFLWLTLLIIAAFMFFVLHTMWYLLPAILWVVLTLFGVFKE